MATWTGYTPYQKFIATLQATNPTLLFKVKSEPQEFRVAAIPPISKVSNSALSTSSTSTSSQRRNNPNRLASSFIRNIRYLPYTKTSFVRIGNSSYFYPMNDDLLANWLRSESLGRFYNQHIKL